MPEELTSEAERLEALSSYHILDTEPERSFDDLTTMAAAICGVPISLVSFVTEDRQWFKAKKGLVVGETSRELSFCAHTLDSKQMLIVPDAQHDPRFKSNSLVTGTPGIRFYAGAPIIETNGHVLGTVCVIDKEPRTLSDEQAEALKALARQAVALLEHRQISAAKTELAAMATEAANRAERVADQLQLAMDAADLAAWFYDPDRGVVGGDARIAELFGLPVSEGPAEMWLAAIIEDDRARVANEFAASIAGAPYDTTYRVNVRGELRWLHARAKVSTGPQGVIRMVGICEDVSRERLLATDLAKTAERLAIAQNVSGAVTFDWDLKKDEVSWGGDFFGRSQEELSTSGKSLTVLPESDREKLVRVLEAAIQSGESYYHEFRAIWPDGRMHWCSTAGKPLRDEHGRVVSIVGVNLDITDRKLSEEALLRTEKLAAVGRLASVVSHEINNPLEAVTNLLYIVRHSSNLSQQDKEYLELADRELARVAQITAQTLRFHKNSSAPGKIQAGTMVHELLALYRTRLVASNIEVRLDLGENVSFYAYEGDIRQVLNNLMANAFDAMRKGGSLYIRSRSISDPATRKPGASITIADSGSGIPWDIRPRIFEAFHSTKDIHGTGLGLWISKRIVQKHNGHLAFRSSTGAKHGTVFRLWVPNEAATSAGEGWA